MDGTTRDEPGAEVAEDARLSHHPERPSRRRVRTPLSILHEDDAVIVVDKPPGLLSVPTAAHEKDTLLSRVSLYLQHRYRRRPYVGVVHRLDRDTSGALAFARTRESLRFLQRLFASHEIDREYVALVAGEPAASGSLDAPLAGDGTATRRRVARKGEAGRRARTRYRVLERFAGASRVAVALETGRTHQIRIHFAESGHPVLGDRVYGRREAPPALEAPRQMLHARRLGFPHPAGGAPVRAESPLPTDFAEVLARWRGRPAPQKKSAPGRPGRERKSFEDSATRAR